MQIEIWKKINGHEDSFEVSNMGRIKSLRRPIISKCGIRYVRERIRALCFVNGYMACGLKKGELNSLVHRLVAMAFIPNPENKPFVNHKNGIKTDNRVENLEWVTRQENEDHAYTTGLKNSTGSANTMAILNEAQVIEIRKGADCGQQFLAGEYGVSVATISRILRRKTWKHI